MPVSPQDFELYSRMTGAPMPSDAMSRMQMAPEVYQFTRNFAKNPNILEKTGNLLKNIGRGAVMTLGAPLVAASEAEQARMSEQLRNQAAKVDSEEATVPNPTEENVKSQPVSPAIAKIEKEMELEDKKHKNKLELEDRRDARAAKNIPTTSEKADNLIERVKSRIDDPQEPTTADAYGQPVVQNQTKEGVIDKKMEQGSDMAFENDTVAEVLSESQDSQPVEFVDPKQVQSQMESDMIGASATSKRVSSFLDKVGGSGQQKVDPILLAAIQERDQEEKFSDHPDIVGGEDDSSVPGQLNMEARGMNTGATSDLSAHHKEMRKMDAMERNKEAIDEILEKSPSPSEMQVGKSPNELAGKDQATFEALMNRAAQTSTDSEAARSRVEQKTAAKQRMSGIKTPLTDKYYPSNVARTDIQVGGMVDKKTGLGKSVGISYTPMNGDTKVGFNIMSDPTKPTEVSTFDFVAPPNTMKSLESREEDSLGTKSFGKLFNIARQKKQGFSGIEM